MFSTNMVKEIERSWDMEEEYNLKNKIEKFWAEDDEEAYGGFASHNLQGSHCFHRTGNQCTDHHAVGLSQFNLQEVDSSPRLLGLTLKKTPSFMNLLEMRVSTPNVGTRDNLRAKSMNNVGCQSLSEKLKASNFPISTIKIGDWRRLSMREGDLTAKVYYTKKKLVWEVLDGHLKSKMEILWSDITAIKAVMLQNQPGILQIELDKPPLFFRETTPEPRKHTTWQQASDFTGGQAPQYRRHIAIFPSGVLDKHYDKLLQCDQHLFELSQRPFPSHESPYFNTVVMPFDHISDGLPVNFHGLGPSFIPVDHQYPYPPAAAYPTTSIVVAPLNSTITVDTPNRNETASNSQHQQQFFPVEEPSPTTRNQVFPGHNYPFNVATLNEIEKHLLGDTHIVCTDQDEGTTHLAQVQSMGSLFIPNNNNAVINHSGGLMGNYQIIDDATSVDQVMMMQNATHDNVSIVQPISWMPPPLQGSNDSSIIRMQSEGLDNFIPLANGDLFPTALYPNQGVLKKY